MAILVVVTFGVASIIKAQIGDQSNWKETMEKSITAAQAQLETEGVPEFAKQEIRQTIAVNQYAIDNNVNPNSMWKVIKDLSDLLQMITIFVVIIVGDMVAGEFTWGTIKMLLIRPVSRTKILLSKYISTVLFALFLMAVLFISSLVISGMLFGFGDVGAPHLYVDGSGTVQEGSMVASTLKTYGLKSVELLMVVTIAFMISTVFRSSSMAIGFSIFIMFTGQLIAELLLSKFSWGKYFLSCKH